jgi:hypothetical protein
MQEAVEVTVLAPRSQDSRDQEISKKEEIEVLTIRRLTISNHHRNVRSVMNTRGTGREAATAEAVAATINPHPLLNARFKRAEVAATIITQGEAAVATRIIKAAETTTESEW